MQKEEHAESLRQVLPEAIVGDFVDFRKSHVDVAWQAVWGREKEFETDRGIFPLSEAVRTIWQT